MQHLGFPFLQHLGFLFLQYLGFFFLQSCRVTAIILADCLLINQASVCLLINQDTMFRFGAARALSGLGPRSIPHASKLCTISRAARPQALAKPTTLALASRYATQQAPMDKINKEYEQKVAAEKLQANPEVVSSTSSTHPVFGEVGMPEDQHNDADMMAGVKSDLVSDNAQSLLSLASKILILS